MDKAPVGRDIFGSKRRSATIAIAVLIACKLALLFGLAWNTRFVMDEFQQLGWAKHFGHGLFDTVWPAKAVGYAVFYKLAHAIGWDATSILLAGRLQTALLACATLAIVYACARALGEDKARALLIVLLLLSFSNIMERIFRTRAEPLALFFAACALLVILRGNADKARTILAAGLLSGLSFLTTQKGVYFNLALGIALAADAGLGGRYRAALERGWWLVVGWLAPVALYCFVFGGFDPVPVAKSLAFGPVEVAMQGAAPYSGLRNFVLQTLSRNALLYALCFAGMVLALLQVRSLDQRKRIALIFTVVITALIFVHDQPWPYVFIMALPFMALWSLGLFDRVAGNGRVLAGVWILAGTALAASFARNVVYFEVDNREQLDLVARAESLVAPADTYFDGVAMLPNRREPSPLWLDRSTILATRGQGANSEAHGIFARSAPKVILWSYRMDGIAPVVGPLIENSYVKIAPNIRLAGRQLTIGKWTAFEVPIAGTYALYGHTGQPVSGLVEVDGRLLSGPFTLARGRSEISLRGGPATALLLPVGSYAGIIDSGPDSDQLFARVYD